MIRDGEAHVSVMLAGDKDSEQHEGSATSTTQPLNKRRPNNETAWKLVDSLTAGETSPNASRVRPTSRVKSRETCTRIYETQVTSEAAR